MEAVALEMRVSRLIVNGHIPLPCSLTVAAEFLGTHDASSLPQAVLKSPAMGETAGRRSGLPVVKLKPGIYGRGHEAAPSADGEAILLTRSRVAGSAGGLHH